MSTVASPVAGLPVPLASLATTLRLQLARLAIAGFGIASGGPKKQFAIRWQLSPMPPQSASDVQGLCGSAPVQAPPVPQPVAVKQLAPGVGVVVLDVDVVVGAGLLVVVVGAALLVVVVGAALLVVVVGAALLVVVVGAALLVVVVGAALLVVVVGAALLVVVVGAALLVVVVGAALDVVV